MPSAKPKSSKPVRRTVSLPREIAEQVNTLAKHRGLSENRLLVELIEQGIEAGRQEENAFFERAERFRAASDPKDIKQLGEQMGRFVFGE